LFPFVAEAKSGRMQKSRKRKLDQEKEEINGNVEIKKVGQKRVVEGLVSGIVHELKNRGSWVTE